MGVLIVAPGISAAVVGASPPRSGGEAPPRQPPQPTRSEVEGTEALRLCYSFPLHGDTP